MDFLLRLSISLFLGFIVGLDRDESWQDKSEVLISRFTFIKPGRSAKGVGGVRTFTLISILGFISGITFAYSPSLAFISILGLISLIGLTIASYILNYLDKNTLGLTTEISILILFILSFLIGADIIDYKLAFGIGIITTLILSLKLEVRKAVSFFTKREIVESLEFILLTVVIFPLLPNINITFKNIFDLIHYSNPAFENIVLFNPQGLWTVVVFVTSLNFIGYFLAKLLKNDKSILITALLGGLVSSTTVTELMAIRSRDSLDDEKTTDLLVASALIANSVSFIRIPILAFLLNQNLASLLGLSMLVMTVIGFGASILSVRGNNSKVESGIIFVSPLAIKPALFFAFIFVSVQIITQFGLIFFGNTGFAVSTLIASISGLDAVTINTSRAIPGIITLEFGALILLGATIVNLIFKLILTLFTGSEYFNKRLTLFISGIVVAGITGLVLMLI